MYGVPEVSHHVYYGIVIFDLQNLKSMMFHYRAGFCLHKSSHMQKQNPSYNSKNKQNPNKIYSKHKLIPKPSNNRGADTVYYWPTAGQKATLIDVIITTGCNWRNRKLCYPSNYLPKYRRDLNN